MTNAPEFEGYTRSPLTVVTSKTNHRRIQTGTRNVLDVLRATQRDHGLRFWGGWVFDDSNKTYCWHTEVKGGGRSVKTEYHILASPTPFPGPDSPRCVIVGPFKSYLRAWWAYQYTGRFPGGECRIDERAPSMKPITSRPGSTPKSSNGSG